MLPGYGNGIWLWKICHADNNKEEKRFNGKNRTTKPR